MRPREPRHRGARTLPSAAWTTSRGSSALCREQAIDLVVDRAGSAARRGRRGRAAARRRRRLRARAGRRAHRGLEGLREGRHARGRSADRRRARRARARASSRPTASRRARASSSAARRPRLEALGARARSSATVVVEELLEGEEVSLFALTDGAEVVPLAPAQDFKRLGDGDEGPNTGGMGSYSPVPLLAEDDVEELVELVHRPVLAELARRGAPFVGLPVRRPDADRGRAARARVQLPLRRPRDAGDPPRLDGDLLSRSPARGRARSTASSSAAERPPSRSSSPRRAIRRPADGRPDRRHRGGRGDRGARLPRGHGPRTGALVSAGGRVLDVRARRRPSPKPATARTRRSSGSTCPGAVPHRHRCEAAVH